MDRTRMLDEAVFGPTDAGIGCHRQDTGMRLMGQYDTTGLTICRFRREQSACPRGKRPPSDSFSEICSLAESPV